MCHHELNCAIIVTGSGPGREKRRSGGARKA